MSFPFDWIEPGEFRYCHCGLYLSDTMACKHTGDDLAHAIDKHEQLKAFRNAIAIERQKTLLPLYWMHCICQDCSNKQNTFGICKKCNSKKVVFDDPFEHLNPIVGEVR